MSKKKMWKSGKNWVVGAILGTALGVVAINSTQVVSAETVLEKADREFRLGEGELGVDHFQNARDHFAAALETYVNENQEEMADRVYEALNLLGEMEEKQKKDELQKAAKLVEDAQSEFDLVNYSVAKENLERALVIYMEHGDEEKTKEVVGMLETIEGMFDELDLTLAKLLDALDKKNKNAFLAALRESELSYQNHKLELQLSLDGKYGRRALWESIDELWSVMVSYLPTGSDDHTWAIVSQISVSLNSLVVHEKDTIAHVRRMVQSNRVPLIQQKRDHGCWEACCQYLLRLSGVHQSQDQIFAAATRKIRSANGRTAWQLTYEQDLIFSDPRDVSAGPNTIMEVAKHFGHHGLYFGAIERDSNTVDVLKRCLEQGPVTALVENNDLTGSPHWIVVKFVDEYGYVYFLDPLFAGNDQDNLSCVHFKELFHSTQLLWNGTQLGWSSAIQMVTAGFHYDIPVPAEDLALLQPESEIRPFVPSRKRHLLQHGG